MFPRFFNFDRIFSNLVYLCDSSAVVNINQAHCAPLTCGGRGARVFQNLVVIVRSRSNLIGRKNLYVSCVFEFPERIPTSAWDVEGGVGYSQYFQSGNQSEGTIHQVYTKADEE